MRGRAVAGAAAALLATLAILAAPYPRNAYAAAQREGDADTVRIGPIVAHYWPGRRRLAEVVVARALGAPPLPALPADILHQSAPIHVFFPPDAERFDSLTGGVAPEWGAGIAFPARSTIVLPGYLSERAAPHQLGRILRHELAHIALHRYLAPQRPPRWFDEGYARLAAGEWDAAAAWQLRLAFATGNAPPLDSLALDWPTGAVDASIAYLLATTAVAYLVDRGGERGLRLFLERWKESGSIETAMRRTYGLTLGQFEEDWREEVREDFGWTYFFAHSLIFWAVAGVLLLILVLLRRRRDRERLARLRAAEPPDSPAYWLGEEAGPPAPDESEPRPPEEYRED